MTVLAIVMLGTIGEVTPAVMVAPALMVNAERVAVNFALSGLLIAESPGLLRALSA